ncbi:hypothetical protein SS50377_25316 [Spironucleus salmonicida]|uniref:Uncharacterized protein n=1 Tax=Spironucleus salmonicida TaxID=348837 RepID=V6LM67_9EUKA|nr:hypothetical protein SS50377_25316 [Spironucleus salmonicida]|eukprot:EST41804.1 Hypothetical protein SS50377_18637 [Spironucleus salmonicida]
MLKTSIFDYDVYYPRHNWAHSKHLANQLRSTGKVTQLPVSALLSESKIKQKQGSLLDFIIFFEISPQEQQFLLKLSPVETAIACKNYQSMYSLTNKLKNSLEEYDDLTDFCLAALQNKSGNVQNLFIKLSEFIKIVFTIIELIQKLRNIQQQPLFYEIYDGIIQNEVFSVQNVFSIFQIFRQFAVFKVGNDDAILDRIQQVGENFQTKMLLGVGKLGRLLYVGILRILSYQTTFQNYGKYYYELLYKEEKTLQVFQNQNNILEQSGYKQFTVNIRGKIDILDIYPLKTYRNDILDDQFDIYDMKSSNIRQSTLVTEEFDDFE